MRAKEEFMKWTHKEKLVGAEAVYEETYTTGFNRAVELMELFLKEKQDENECIS